VGKGYQDLAVWQKSIELVVAAYRLTARFPAREQYGLTDQIRRAATSVPANLAEGQARGYARDFRRFIMTAAGSLAELETHLIVAQRLEYSTTEEIGRLLEQASEVGRMMNGLLRSLNVK
jgi:four helix bundle protein